MYNIGCIDMDFWFEKRDKSVLGIKMKMKSFSVYKGLFFLVSLRNYIVEIDGWLIINCFVIFELCYFGKFFFEI